MMKNDLNDNFGVLNNHSINLVKVQKQQLFIENMMEYDEWKNSNIIINNYRIISIFRINLDNIHVTIYHILCHIIQ